MSIKLSYIYLTISLFSDIITMLKIIYRGVAQLVARLLWAKSTTASCGRCRECELAKRSKFCERVASEKFWVPREGEQSKASQIKRKYHRGVAQLVARLLWEQDVGSSNLFTPTTKTVDTIGFQRFLLSSDFGGCDHNYHS